MFFWGGCHFFKVLDHNHSGLRYYMYVSNCKCKYWHKGLSFFWIPAEVNQQVKNICKLLPVDAAQFRGHFEHIFRFISYLLHHVLINLCKVSWQKIYIKTINYWCKINLLLEKVTFFLLSPMLVHTMIMALITTSTYVPCDVAWCTNFILSWIEMKSARVKPHIFSVVWVDFKIFPHRL